MHNIKKIYLYAVSLISLVMLVIAGVMLINMGLKATIFTKADSATSYYSEPCNNTTPSSVPNQPQIDCSDSTKKQRLQDEKDRQAGQRQNDAAHAIALIIVAAPVFYYHWRLARREQ